MSDRKKYLNLIFVFSCFVAWLCLAALIFAVGWKCGVSFVGISAAMFAHATIRQLNTIKE